MRCDARNIACRGVVPSGTCRLGGNTYCGQAVDKQWVLLIVFLEHLAERYGTLQTWSPRNIIPCLADWPKQLLMPARPSETQPIAEALWSSLGSLQ
jgi:hypothetical protein